MKTKTQANQTTATPTTATPDPTTTSEPTAAEATTAAPVATPTEQKPKPTKTPEQKAAQMRREAGELRRAAKTLGEDSDGGKSLVLRATGLEADADVLAPRKTKSGEARPTCAGTKKDGSSCTAHAMEGSEFCTDHRPVRARFSDAEWDAFGRISQSTLVERLGWGVAQKLAKAQLEAEKTQS